VNWVAVLILAALLLEFILELIADILNLRAMKDRPPEGFEDVFDPERYPKSQQYLRANTRFGWIGGGFDLLVLLLFWFGGGFAWLDRWTRSLGWGEVLAGLIFVGVLMAGRSLLHLPFAVYHTFVLEERFGFNRTTPKTFVMDRLKGMGLSAAIGGPLLAAILAFFDHFGPEAWLPCWLAVTGFSLLLQFVAPAWIMPLFLKFEPLEDGELRTAAGRRGASDGNPGLRRFGRFPAHQRLRGGRLPPLGQVQRLFYRIREEQAGGAVRHADRAAHGPGVGGGAGPRGGPLQAEAHPPKHGHRDRPDRHPVLPVLPVHLLAATVRGVLYRHALGPRRAGFLRDVVLAHPFLPGHLHAAALPEKRIRGGRIRGENHGGRVGDDRGAEKAFGPQSLQPGAASVVRFSPLLAPADCGAGAGD